MYYCHELANTKIIFLYSILQYFSLKHFTEIIEIYNYTNYNFSKMGKINMVQTNAREIGAAKENKSLTPAEIFQN